ncbi:hypothetical protein BGZ60DRAFT_398746 [Tricladium varicosporioides]|nr:hypothetical protein BGZ60DRAFT_398746 [Hymenoscyphus varicosporioides]
MMWLISSTIHRNQLFSAMLINLSILLSVNPFCSRRHEALFHDPTSRVGIENMAICNATTTYSYTPRSTTGKHLHGIAVATHFMGIYL